MLQIQRLSFEILHTCNLHCDGCNHYANFGIQQELTVEEIALQFENWASKIQPQFFKILGGEPLMHPQLETILRTARFFWKESKLLLSTNGLLLYKLPHLGDWLLENRVSLIFTRHSNDQRLVNSYAKAEESLRSLEEMGVSVFRHDGTSFWIKTYQDKSSSPKPFFDGNPAASWNACSNKRCFTLFENKIFKCPPLAYLKFLDQKFNIRNDPDWIHYLKYRPLTSDVGELEIKAFFDLEAEEFCSMCPTRPELLMNKSVFKTSRMQNGPPLSM